MRRRPPRFTRTDTLFPYTTLFLSFDAGMDGVLNKPIKLGKLRGALQLWTDAPLDDAESVTLSATDRRAIMMAFEDDLLAMRRARQYEDFERAAHFAQRLTGAFGISDARDLGAITRDLERMFRRQGQVPFPFYSSEECGDGAECVRTGRFRG